MGFVVLFFFRIFGSEFKFEIKIFHSLGMDVSTKLWQLKLLKFSPPFFIYVLSTHIASIYNEIFSSFINILQLFSILFFHSLSLSHLTHLWCDFHLERMTMELCKIEALNIVIETMLQDYFLSRKKKQNDKTRTCPKHNKNEEFKQKLILKLWTFQLTAEQWQNGLFFVGFRK